MNTRPSPEVKELQAIKKELHHLRGDFDKTIHAPFWQRSLSAFGVGVIKGVGFTIGTTLVAAFVIFILNQFVDWAGIGQALEIWVQTQLGGLQP